MRLWRQWGYLYVGKGGSNVFGWEFRKPSKLQGCLFSTSRDNHSCRCKEREAELKQYREIKSVSRRLRNGSCMSAESRHLLLRIVEPVNTLSIMGVSLSPP